MPQGDSTLSSSASNGSTSAVELLSRRITLPCGIELPNRIAKAPMEEMLGSFGGGLPNEAHLRLYREWAKGGWGMIITGNVTVDAGHLGLPFDVALPPPPHKDPHLVSSFKAYADACTGRSDSLPSHSRPIAVVQLVHAGRQSMRGFGRKPWVSPQAPSAVRMRPNEDCGAIGNALDWALFGVPAAMSREEVKEMIEKFAAAAELCAKAGFDGVELHASHGYMLAAFLSPRTNQRTDEYGGSARNRIRVLLDIATEVRRRCPKQFCVGVKLNSADYVQGGLTEEDALENVRWLAEHGGIDFVEVSGGSYENPSFMMDKFDAEDEKAKLSSKSASAPSSSRPKPYTPQPSTRTARREAFFLSFAQRAHSVLPSSSRMVIILTGGLRSRAGMASALSSGEIDMVALGRPAAVDPALPLRLLDRAIPDSDARAKTVEYTIPASAIAGKLPIQLVGAGWGMQWHCAQMARVAYGLGVDLHAPVGELMWTLFVPPESGRNLGKHVAALTVLIAFLVALGTTYLSIR